MGVILDQVEYSSIYTNEVISIDQRYVLEELIEGVTIHHTFKKEVQKKKKVQKKMMSVKQGKRDSSPMLTGMIWCRNLEEYQIDVNFILIISMSTIRSVVFELYTFKFCSSKESGKKNN